MDSIDEGEGGMNAGSVIYDSSRAGLIENVERKPPAARLSCKLFLVSLKRLKTGKPRRSGR